MKSVRFRRETRPVRGRDALAVQVEQRRRQSEHLNPDAVEEAVERWLDPELVDRSLVTNALHEMEGHTWGADSKSCQCGHELYPQDSEADFHSLREHREDVLASMLGLTIRKSS